MLCISNHNHLSWHAFHTQNSTTGCTADGGPYHGFHARRVQQKKCWLKQRWHPPGRAYIRASAYFLEIEVYPKLVTQSRGLAIELMHIYMKSLRTVDRAVEELYG